MAADRGRALWAAAATLAVCAGIVAGLVYLGSPAERRLRRLDEDRVRRLRSIDDDISTFHSKEGALPPDLEALASKQWVDWVPLDPETHEPFAYEAVSETRYRLCATFARSSPPPPPDEEVDFWSHPEGRHCYELEVEPPEPGPSPAD